ncbi:hypothetical protein [Fuchsiella alkaliacetigena]|uniref:hypothetical protein n=1 Tax=Fuchsiella alkaliacetigena TaxID=957042 RepID=UPI002009F2D0|nr:hypothetical protein [Fuchsiella alkaliacetigena]MCK8826003.1 hypothetical protein [Fuchsiella alkaliacetigena]
MVKEEQKEAIKKALEDLTDKKEISCEVVGAIAAKVGLEALEAGRIAKEELGYRIPG